MFSYPKVPSRDDVGFCKPLFHIPHHYAFQAVRPENDSAAGYDIAGELVVNEGSTWFEGRIYIEDRGQNLVLHVDKIQCLFRDFLGRSRNERYSVTHVPDFFVEDGTLRGVPPLQSGLSSQVRTAFTPGSASALLLSIFLISAWA